MGKETDLLNAVKEGNGQHVRKTLHKYRRSTKKNSNKKSNINLTDTEGFTALHYAALSGDVDMVMAIIEMEGDPNCRDKKGMTPVHLAAWAGKENTIKALLENNGLPNLASHNGDTPLHQASQHGYAQCAKVLLESHADPSVRNNNAETPLDLACQFGHTSVVRQLLNNEKVTFHLISPERSAEHKSPLHLSSKSGHDDIVHLLLQAGANVNEQDVEGTPLHLAALFGKTKVVKLLLQAGADVYKCNKNGLIALDLIKSFTTSRAGLEIKQMLREAAGEKICFASAVSDYHNQYDDSCLSFKSGDNIAVIEMNENGRWRGYVVNSETERVGFFPAMAVHLIDTRKTHSICSRTSSVTSADSLGTRSVNSTGASPNRTNGPKSPERLPVGVVSIGNFDVVTLSQNDAEIHAPPKQTASGSLPPRMNSFKKVKRPHFQSPPSEPAPPPPPLVQPLPPSVVQQPPQSPRIIPPQRQSFQPQPLTKKGPSRSFSEKRPPTQQNGGLRTMERSLSNSTSSSDVESRGRASSSGSAQYELAKALQQGLSMRKSDSEKPQGNYADVEYTSGDSTPSHKSFKNTSQQQQQQPSEYTRVYFEDSTHTLPTDSHQIYVNTQNVNNQNGSRSSDNHNGSQNSETKYINKKNNYYNNDNTAQSFSPVHQHFKPTLHKSKSSDNNHHVKFAPNEILNSSSIYENISKASKRVQGDHPPQLPLKRSQTMPKSHGIARNVNNNNSDSDNYSISSSSSSQSHTPLIQASGQYENTILHLTGSRSPRSPRSPRSQYGVNAFPILQNSPDSTDGSFAFPLDQKLSKTDQDLINWLTEMKLVCYFDNFKSQGFDMVSVRAITPEDLTLLEISKAGHRKKLLGEIAKLPPTDQLSNEKPHDVGSWLGQLNLRQYEPNFVEGGFDDIDFIKDLDKNDLEMIDIKKKGHQKKLIMAVQRLNELELTEILDIAIAESPIKRAKSFNTESRPEIHSFFPDIPLELSSPASPRNMSTAPLSPREELPPPSGQEEQNQAHSPLPVSNGVVKKAPVPVPPKPHKAPPPAAKPKPKPAVAKKAVFVDGTVQGSQEEVVRSSKSRDFFKQVEKKALTVTDDQDSPPNTMERRKSYSDRMSPAVLSPRKISLPPPAVKSRSNSSSSDTSEKSVRKAPPPAPPKRQGSLTENSPIAVPTPAAPTVSHLPPTQETPEETEATVEPSPRLPTFRPPPPPTKTPPPESTPELPPSEPELPLSEPELPPSEPELELPPPELELPPPPTDTPSSLDTSFPEPSFSPPPPPDLDDLSIEDTSHAAPAPVVEQKPSVPLIIEPITLPNRTGTNDEFAETDDIMSQLMNDLDDFTKDIDSMF